MIDEKWKANEQVLEPLLATLAMMVHSEPWLVARWQSDEHKGIPHFLQLKKRLLFDFTPKWVVLFWKKTLCFVNKKFRFTACTNGYFWFLYFMDAKKTEAVLSNALLSVGWLKHTKTLLMSSDPTAIGTWLLYCSIQSAVGCQFQTPLILWEAGKSQA